MFIGGMRVCLILYDSFSLKDKRSVRTSLIRRIENKFRVSVAEIGEQECHNLLEIGVAVVSSNQRIIEKTLENILRFFEKEHNVEIVENRIEIQVMD